ncbi:hypothetical protein AVEN_18474-1 [Araneus ventricosus]|uniref:Uncharacterized protein n=1 Tax=Araneus ventricosus TaxID=182803 RepID=A0A4Y2X0C6_ARAVE|nr:hypothetical protein AVEN_18474-1 [Araneus ventricosus]
MKRSNTRIMRWFIYHHAGKYQHRCGKQCRTDYRMKANNNSQVATFSAFTYQHQRGHATSNNDNNSSSSPAVNLQADRTPRRSRFSVSVEDAAGQSSFLPRLGGVTHGAEKLRSRPNQKHREKFLFFRELIYLSPRYKFVSESAKDDNPGMHYLRES